MSYLGRYYDGLGRFQRLARWVSRSGDQTLTIHRKLDPGTTGVAPHHVVHERLIAALDGLSEPRVIDAGCGLGGTVFYLHSRVGGIYDGVTLSTTQQARAVRAARRLGVADACRFHARSFDADLWDLVPDGADLVVAVESLAHSPDPANTVGSLARVLRPGGRLAVVDDVPQDALPAEDADLVAFKRGWAAPALARAAELEDAFHAAGLEVAHDEDLTPLVLQRDPDARERRIRFARSLRRVFGATGPGNLFESLLGGLMLERLYARGLMRYRLVVGQLEQRASRS